MHIFVLIHNQSLVLAKEVIDFYEATSMANNFFKEHIGREMNDQEKKSWEVVHEVINTDDSSNHWTFSFGEVN